MNQSLWASVQANHDKLDGCKNHVFSIDLTPEKRFGKRWRCIYCGGEVDTVSKTWYELGRRHEAQGD